MTGFFEGTREKHYTHIPGLGEQRIKSSDQKLFCVSDCIIGDNDSGDRTNMLAGTTLMGVYTSGNCVSANCSSGNHMEIMLVGDPCTCFQNIL